MVAFKMANNIQEKITLLTESILSREKFQINIDDVNDIHMFCKVVQVPILNKSEDDPYNEDDFNEFILNCEGNLKVLEKFVSAFISYPDIEKPSGSFKQLKCLWIITSSQHCNAKQEWSSESCSVVAQNIIKLLLDKEQNDSSKQNDSECSKYEFGDILKLLLLTIAENFNKESFKNNPGMRQFYLWFLHNISYSNLSEQLGYFLPGALFMLDDWEQRHKHTALDALNYIISNVAGSELRQHGRASVIFDVARRSLHSREPEQLHKAYPVAIKAGRILQDDSKLVGSFEFSKLDEVLHTLLVEMCYEQRTDLRKVFTVCLPIALEAAGIRALLCTAEFIKVLENYASTTIGSSSEEILNVLTAVECFMSHCWCLYHTVAEKILSILVRLMCDCSGTDTSLASEEKKKILEMNKRIAQLSCQIAPETTAKLVKGVNKLKVDQDIMESIEFVFESALLL